MPKPESGILLHTHMSFNIYLSKSEKKTEKKKLAFRYSTIYLVVNNIVYLTPSPLPTLTHIFSVSESRILQSKVSAFQRPPIQLLHPRRCIYN